MHCTVPENGAWLFLSMYSPRDGPFEPEFGMGSTLGTGMGSMLGTGTLGTGIGSMGMSGIGSMGMSGIGSKRMSIMPAGSG